MAKIASAYPDIARLNAPPKSRPDLRSLQQGLHHVEAIACLYARMQDIQGKVDKVTATYVEVSLPWLLDYSTTVRNSIFRIHICI